MWSKQVAPNGANICYGILSCYKQVAPTELMIDLSMPACAVHADRQRRHRAQADKFFKILNCYQRSYLREKGLTNTVDSWLIWTNSLNISYNSAEKANGTILASQAKPSQIRPIIKWINPPLLKEE